MDGHLDGPLEDYLSFEEFGTDTDSYHSSLSVGGSSVLSRPSAKCREPIVVGYAFGPKKMRSMGVVMAEASRVKVIHEVPEEDEEEEAIENEVDEEGCAEIPRKSMDSYARQYHKRAPSTLTSDALQDLAKDDSVMYTHQYKKASSPLGTTVITLGNFNESSDLRHIVRYFRSNCSSAAESLASMSETSGSNTLVSLNNTSSGSKNRRRGKTHCPILISFVPLDPDQPLED
jgi:hypothetical protein